MSRCDGLVEPKLMTNMYIDLSSCR